MKNMLVTTIAVFMLAACAATPQPRPCAHHCEHCAQMKETAGTPYKMCMKKE